MCRMGGRQGEDTKSGTGPERGDHLELVIMLMGSESQRDSFCWVAYVYI